MRHVYITPKLFSSLFVQKLTKRTSTSAGAVTLLRIESELKECKMFFLTMQRKRTRPQEDVEISYPTVRCMVSRPVRICLSGLQGTVREPAESANLVSQLLQLHILPFPEFYSRPICWTYTRQDSLLFCIVFSNLFQQGNSRKKQQQVWLSFCEFLLENAALF